jgi:hypothetical protein
MNVLPQPDTKNRLLEPFEAGTRAGRRHRTESLHGDIDVGCVDWYLYPVSRKALQREALGTAPRGAAVAPAGENPSA